MLHLEKKMRSASNDNDGIILLSILLTVNRTSKAFSASIPCNPHSLDCTLAPNGGPGKLLTLPLISVLTLFSSILLL